MGNTMPVLMSQLYYQALVISSLRKELNYEKSS